MLHRFNTGLSPGYGFVAIAVALVGNLEPVWIVVAAFAFGILQNGALSMQAEANVPRDVVERHRGARDHRAGGTALRRVAALDVNALAAGARSRSRRSRWSKRRR